MPAWFAAIVQVPAATIVTLLAETVHTEVVVELNATARPEVALAVSAMGVVLKLWFAGPVKEIVWLALAMVSVKLWLTLPPELVAVKVSG